LVHHLHGSIIYSVTDWTTSIGDYQYWRVIQVRRKSSSLEAATNSHQQSQPEQLLSLLRSVSKGKEHDYVVALEKHFQEQLKQSERRLLSQCEFKVNSAYSVQARKGVFAFKIQISRPEILSLVSAKMTIHPFLSDHAQSHTKRRFFTSLSHDKFDYAEFPDVDSVLSWTTVADLEPNVKLEEASSKTNINAFKRLRQTVLDVVAITHVTCDVEIRCFTRRGFYFAHKATAEVWADYKRVNTLVPVFEHQKSWKNEEDDEEDAQTSLQFTWKVDGQDRKDYLAHPVGDDTHPSPPQGSSAPLFTYGTEILVA